MSLPGFATIAREQPRLIPDLQKIEDAILGAGPRPALSVKSISVVTGVGEPAVSYVLNKLVAIGDLREEEILICDACGLQVPSSEQMTCEFCDADLTKRSPRKERYMTWDGVVGRTPDFWNATAQEARIGIVTALPTEAVAVLQTLGEVGETARDGVVYDVGLAAGIGGAHGVVHATSGMGNTAAGVVGTRMLIHFPTLQHLIMVGIAGMVPDPADAEKHARLGDVVVSNEKGVVEFDLRKEGDGWEEVRCAPMRPGARLLDAVQRLRRREVDGTKAEERPWVTPIARIAGSLGVTRPAEETDVLHAAEEPFAPVAHPVDPSRSPGVPRVHVAPIASSGTLLKNPKRRDELGRQHHVRAVEMEGAGVAEAAWAGARGYLVIRGGCDYCDKFKNNDWQRYAAVVAAAYLEALLRYLAVT
jgi:nucleoside phosphorylase